MTSPIVPGSTSCDGSGVAVAGCSASHSGRTAIRTAVPIAVVGIGTRHAAPSRSTTFAMPSPNAATVPSSRFISPMKLATKRCADAGRSPLGEPTCTTRPVYMTAMRSDIVSASSWSCVTKMNVMPSALLELAHFELHLLAQLLVERAERLVDQHHPRFEHQRAGERHALLLAARELRGLPLAERPGRAAPGPAPATRARPRRPVPALRKPKATFSATVMCGNKA